MAGLAFRAQGCYGAVYVRKGDDGQKYAIKRLHDILLGRGKEEKVDPEAKRKYIEKFENECEVLKGLNHVNVVKFIRVEIGPEGRDEGDISLVMEYVDMNLKEFLDQNPLCSTAVRFGILQDIASGLCYLHRSKIIHRDLNQGNVLITQDNSAKIADLGCSRLFPASALSRAMTVCPGAADYMPPEAKAGNAVYGPKLDCFSFGHLSLYVCNNEYPNPDDNKITGEDASLNHRQIGKRREALVKMHESFPFLSNLVTKCLSDMPEDRPTSEQIFSWLLQCSLHSSCKKVDHCQTQQRNSIIAIDFGSTAVKVAYKIGEGDVMGFYFRERLNLHDTTLLLDLGELKDLKKSGKDTKSWIMVSFGNPLQRASRFSIEALKNILSFVKQEVEGWMREVGLSDVGSVCWSIAVSGSWPKRIKDNILEATQSLASCNSQPCQGIALVDRTEAAALSYLHSSPEIPSIKSFLTVRIGSSSTDVGIHWTDERGRLVTGCSSGVYCGGRTIDESLYSFLSDEILKDSDFEIFKKANSVDYYTELNEIFTDFEKTKRQFADDPESVPQHFSIILPYSFVEVYEKKLRTFELDPSLVRYSSRRQQLFIPKEKLKEWFNNCLSQVQHCVDAVISSAGDKEAKLIYLVGRFAGFFYVSEYIRAHSNNRMVICRDSGMAIAHGACLNSNMTLLHVSMATYGIMCNTPHHNQNTLHEQTEEVQKTDRKFYASPTFHPLISKGELVDSHTMYKCVLTPVFPEQCTISVSLYSTTRDDPSVILDAKTGNVLEGVAKLVQKTIDIRAGMEDLGMSERQVEVTIQFGKGEITLSLEYNRHNRATAKVFNHAEFFKI